MPHKNRKPFRWTAPLRLLRLEDRTVPAFAAPVSYAAGGAPSGILSADFNSDGNADLAVLNAGSNSVGVLLGNGDGTFQSALAAPTAAGAANLVSGDFNGDGNVDLATNHGSYSSYKFMILLFGIGDGTFQAPLHKTVPNMGEGFWLASGDVNADGCDDLVTVQLESYFDSFIAVDTLLGHFDGSFSVVSSHTRGYPNAYPVNLADFNEDGNLDVSAPGIITGNGDGTFNDSNDVPMYGSVADFTNDGHVDSGFTWGTSTLTIVSGTGTGQSGAIAGYSTGVAMSDPLPGDFNGDGFIDALASNAMPGVTVLLGNASGTLGPYFYLSTPAGLGSLAVGDFNGDGFDDFAATDSSAGVVKVLVNDGYWTGGTMPPPPSISVSDVTVTEGNTGTQSANFTVSLSFAWTQTITVQFLTAGGTAASGTDFQSTGGTVTFTPGQTTQTIIVPVIGDRTTESTESFFVNLSSPTNATISDGQGVCTINDNEPRVSITDVSMTEGNSGTKNFVFFVSLSAAYDQAVTMSFRTVNGTAISSGSQADYVAQTGTLNFAAGQTNKTISIQVKGDRRGESNETFNVELFNLSSNGLFSDNWGLGTILTDD